MSSTTILDVPYFVQSKSNNCQSTVLKMYARYLSEKIGMSSPGANKDVSTIWKEINTGTKRPVRVRNAHKNMAWWLQSHFPPIKFELQAFTNAKKAIDYVTQRINHGYPVIASTNHSRTRGHIILIVGYQKPNMSRRLKFGATSEEVNQSFPVSKPNYESVKFIVHDPYGKFNPQLGSSKFAKNRYDGGMSLLNGGELGPGRAIEYDYKGISRMRQNIWRFIAPIM